MIDLDTLEDIDWLVPLPERVEVRKRRRLRAGLDLVALVIWRAVEILDQLEHAPVPEVEPVKRRLPFDQWDWHEKAECRDTDSVVFFGVEFRRGPTYNPEELGVARAICERCPVQRKCLAHALTQPEEFGVWAGTSGQQRAKMQREIERGATVEELVDRCLAPTT